MTINRLAYGSLVAAVNGNLLASTLSDWVEAMVMPRGSLCVFRNIDAWVVHREVFPRMISSDLYAFMDEKVSSLTDGRWGSPVEAQLRMRRGYKSLLITWKSSVGEREKSTCCACMVEAPTIEEKLRTLFSKKNKNL